MIIDIVLYFCFFLFVLVMYAFPVIDPFVILCMFVVFLLFDDVMSTEKDKGTRNGFDETELTSKSGFPFEILIGTPHTNT
jgi:hypothetical protein